MSESCQKSTHSTAANAGKGLDKEVGISPLAHVGKTLESDPEYNNLPEGPGSSMAEEMISRSGNDLTASPNMKAGTDRLAGTEIERDPEPERLITRLPGDTSSDPHTDVGPDNATTVQDRKGL